MHIVDAFTTTPFSGNPAAVVILDEPGDERWMQALAAELRLSETAFVRPRADGAYDLRWFTPTAEVDLCGHATLASAHVLWETGARAPGDAILFHTRSGVLTSTRRGAAIELDFPAHPPTACPPPPGLYAALGIERGEWVGRSRFDLVVVLSTADQILALRPDFRALVAIECRGVSVTAPGTTADFVSRFFAPRVGVDEDPVTGSAHTMLGPYWAARLRRTRLHAVQLSERRGHLEVEVVTDRVLLRGSAVTVIRGAWAVPERSA